MKGAALSVEIFRPATYVLRTRLRKKGPGTPYLMNIGYLGRLGSTFYVLACRQYLKFMADCRVQVSECLRQVG